MSLRIVRSSLIVRDIAQIWSYIADDNVEAADRLVHALNDSIKRLAENPELGSVAGLRDGLRCKPVRRRYLIFYIATSQELQVLRILHGARDYERLFAEE